VTDQLAGEVARDTEQTPEETPAAHRRGEKVLRRIISNPLAVFGLLFIVLLLAMVALAPYVAPHDPAEQNYLAIEEPPSVEHPFGTDSLGRDVLSRTLHGAQYALFLGVTIVGIQMGIGVPLGLIAGYYGGATEAVIMRIVDIALAIPGVVLALAIAGMLGGGLYPLIVAIGLVGWRDFARLVRGDVKSVMEEEYIDAAQASGAPDRYIISRYVLPNASASIIVYATLTLPTVVLWAAGLSFLGVGAQPPTPEWGALVADGRDRIDTAWWISTFPGFAIMLTVIAFNVVGDALRDALDPKQAR